MGVLQRGKPPLREPKPNSLPKPMKTFEEVVRLARDFDHNCPIMFYLSRQGDYVSLFQEKVLFILFK